MTLRLITIPISHYCEKARWALDRSGLPYVEERHLQVFHYAAVKRAGGGISVPCLAGGDAGTLSDSTDIMKWASARGPADRSLYPEEPSQRAEVERLEDELDEGFGPATRRLVYWYMLPRKDLALAYNPTGVPGWQRRLFPFIYPAAKLFLRRRLKITDAAVQKDEADIRRVFDDIARRLGGRRYLVGDRLSAADVTFASLAAPVLLPDEYGVPLPRPGEVPAALHTLCVALRQHQAGQFALRLFREERQG
jgi:glutathione S-transferase